MPIYNYSQLENDVQDLAHGTLGNLKQKRSLINRAVREVWREVDIRSGKRSSALSPSIARTQNQYTKPSDLKGLALVDVKPRSDRRQGWSGEAILTTPEEFDRMKRSYRNVMAIDERDFVGKLLISKVVDDGKTTLQDYDSLTGNGDIAVVAGTPANNLTLDKNNFINGTGSANFDVDTTGTDPAVETTDATVADLTNYESNQIFLWMFIPLTDPSVITNIQLRWGNDDANYYQRQITVNNEGYAFQQGWNLLRFDWDENVTEGGSPDITDIDYNRVTVNLSAVLGSASTDWRLDFLVARRGVIHDVIYYSKYAWQTSTGTYIENSTVDTDLLNVDTDEIDLISARVDYLIAKANRDTKMIKLYRQDYKEAKENYQLNYPSEAKALTTTYYELGSLSEDVGFDDVRDTT